MRDVTGDEVAAPAPAPTLAGQVSRAMLWNALLQPARLVAGLVSGIVVANVLTADAYGTIALLSAMAATLGLVLDLGVERALVKFLPEIEARYGREGVRRALWYAVLQKAALLALMVALALAFREHFFAFWRSRVREPETLALLERYRWLFFGALMALVIFGALFDVYMQALVSYFRQRAWNAIVLLYTVLRPLLLAGVVLAGWGVLGVVGAMVTVPVVVTALATWQAATVRRALAERPTQAAAGANVASRFARYSGLSYWVQLTEYAYSLDFVLLLLPGAGVAAGFKVASSLVNNVLSALWGPMVGVQVPLFARLQARGDDRQLAEAYAVLSKFLAAILLPATVGFALLAGNLLATIWPKYAGYAPVARVLTVGLFLDAAIGVPRAILLAYERHRPVLLTRTFALLAIPLLLLAVPRYGALGAALVMAGTHLASGALAMILACRLFPLRYPLRFAGRVALASAAMGAFVAPLTLTLLAPPDGAGPGARLLYLLGNAAVAGLGVAVYLGVLRLSGGLDREDRRRIAELGLPGASLVLRFL